ncbi:hypothetical protein NLX86_14070 [Streptomyces sp. A3M-1-3]|uniref:hypothetical protein n=1 Tax=Streptomyces sp. A3M-1-3 TaxID=2962044 RepID=UPI0020B86F30|nr:hypothetical protein [Streptomyces sp. A3M-1-3]MCP3819192.1 hypothetical protein [Streptomyces sp. A3M-1-3]
MTVPRQSPHPDEGGGKPPEDRRHMIVRRWLTAVIIVLLIGIPAGYLLISAEQSRDSGRDKARKASATGLTPGWPSKVQRSVYDVPIPDLARGVAFYETNNWKTSRLYVQFRTTNNDLDAFLKNVGTSRAALKEGVAIGERDTAVVGWKFLPSHLWWSTTHTQKDPKPTQHITVDFSDLFAPRVYLVSTATP